MEQTSLDAYRDELAEAARGAGEAHALATVSEDGSHWLERAQAAILELAARPRTFTADDVRELAGEAPSSGLPGMVLRRASASGQIRAVGAQTSRRPLRRGSLQRVWAGTIWAEDDEGSVIV